MTKGRAIIYGGKGQLGAKCVDIFKAQGWWTCSIDFMPNEHADANVIVKDAKEWTEQAKQIESDVSAALGSHKVDAICCVAGGWAGGNAASADFIESCDRMWRQRVWTSAVAAQLATKYLKSDGLLQLTGAKAALEGTPGMIGYGMAKAAVHQLMHSLQSRRGGLPKESTVVALLPITLDTPANRSGMPNADYSTWTPLEFVADRLFEWASGKDKRPAHGSLVELITKDGKTDLVIGQLQKPDQMANY